MPQRCLPGPGELAALANVVRDELDEFRTLCGTPSFDESRFLALLQRHQLSGFVHASLDGRPARNLLSQHARERLAGAFVHQWAINERLACELRRLTTLLAAEGCPFLLLKGLHLALAYYGSSDRRGFSDLDILVQPGDVERAIALLERDGYRRRSRALFGRPVAARFTHACELSRQDSTVDLHWAFVRHPAYRIDYEAVWSTSREFDALGAPVRVLGDEYALTFQCLAMLKDLELGTLRLKSLVDLYFLTFACEARIAWDPFLARCERERTLRSVTAALSLMSTLLGTRDLFPRLDRCLASIAPIALPEGIATRLAACRRSTTDRLWASRIQDPSRLRAAAWWAVSLPFRIAAHRPELASRTAG